MYATFHIVNEGINGRRNMFFKYFKVLFLSLKCVHVQSSIPILLMTLQKGNTPNSF